MSLYPILGIRKLLNCNNLFKGKMMVYPRVAIVILNWNGWKDTIECLESLYQINYPKYQVVLVDNNSDDGSISEIKKYAAGEMKVKSNFFEYNSQNKPFKILDYKEDELINNFYKDNRSENLILIKNNQNYGFAKGSNVGISYALENCNPDYILLLNNDTVVDKEFLSKLIKFAETDEKIGIIGPKIYYYNSPDTIQVAGTEMNFWRGTSYLIGDGEVDEGQYDEISESDFVSGSCFLIKREVIDNIGLLDQSFTCYWEESDYCMAAKKLDFKCIYFPNSKVWHKVSKSTNKNSGLLTYYMTRNMFWFMKKHATNLQYAIFLIFFFGIKVWYVNLNFLYSNKFVEIKKYWKGIKEGIFEG